MLNYKNIFNLDVMLEITKSECKHQSECIHANLCNFNEPLNEAKTRLFIGHIAVTIVAILENEVELLS